MLMGGEPLQSAASVTPREPELHLASEPDFASPLNAIGDLQGIDAPVLSYKPEGRYTHWSSSYDGQPDGMEHVATFQPSEYSAVPAACTLHHQPEPRLSGLLPDSPHSLHSSLSQQDCVPTSGWQPDVSPQLSVEEQDLNILAESFGNPTGDNLVFLEDKHSVSDCMEKFAPTEEQQHSVSAFSWPFKSDPTSKTSPVSSLSSMASAPPAFLDPAMCPSALPPIVSGPCGDPCYAATPGTPMHQDFSVHSPAVHTLAEGQLILPGGWYDPKNVFDDASLDKLEPSANHMLLSVKSEVDEVFPLDIELPPAGVLAPGAQLPGCMADDDVMKVETPPPSLSVRPRRTPMPTLKRTLLEDDDLEDCSPHKLRRARTGGKAARYEDDDEDFSEFQARGRRKATVTARGRRVHRPHQKEEGLSGEFLDIGNRRSKHHNPWTVEETEALVAGVETCGGGKWADIKKLGLRAIERRSAVDLKDKWRNLQAALYRPKSDKKREIPAGLLQRVRMLVPLTATKARAEARPPIRKAQRGDKPRCK